MLGGSAGIEEAAARRRPRVEVPFAPGRTDATEEQTDAASFAVLEPVADGFRNFLEADFAVPAEALLVDRAQLLDADRAGDDRARRRPARPRRQPRRSPNGVFTDRPGS